MHLDLRLRDLPAPRIAAIQIGKAIHTLREITLKNGMSGEPPIFKSRKDEMKRRLMERGESVTFEQATDEDGRQRLLLSLYLEHATSAEALWLPDFDESIAKSVLGSNGRDWSDWCRRQATSLFFTYFDRLPALGQLCNRLVEAYQVPSTNLHLVLHQQCSTVFATDGPQKIALAARDGESLSELMTRFAVPKEGCFSARLKEVFLLTCLNGVALGQGQCVLTELEAMKSLPYQAGIPLGAAALRIIVQRVANEGGRKWSDDWSNWITKLGCDPRHGRATAEGAKWWGWATPDELRLAQQGITGRDLRFFIEFLRQSLQGTDKEPQFALRSRFLLALFESGKIQSARLALNWATYKQLDQKYRDVLSVAHLSQTNDDTSMICLKCEDDIFVIEGTHSFGLRMFHQNFPIRDFWEHPKQTYQDRELRISPAKCLAPPIPHDPRGRWVSKFFNQLRNCFHVEWDNVRI